MADVLRVSILGELPGGEKWTVNPVFHLIDSVTPVTVAQLTTISAAIEASTVPAALDAYWTNTTTITGVRLEARKVTGELETLVERTYAAPNPGGGTGNAHPFQTATVSSLRTVTPGAQGRGRLYWPTNAMPLSIATLRPAAADVTTFIGGVKTYLSAIQTAINVTRSGSTLCVWSRTGLGMHNVTSIKVGDVLDVQRRRRDSLVENYQTVTFP